MSPCIGKQEHGHFKDISMGADYYSGGIVMELPTQRLRITDLERITPKIYLLDNNNLMVSAKIKTSEGTINKTITIEQNTEKISLGYEFDGFNIIGSVRAGIITLIDTFSRAQSVSCANGGDTLEHFNLNQDFDHTRPASTLVSSSRALGATTGKIVIATGKNKINFNWDMTNAAVLPMMLRKTSGDKTLLRLQFSLQEIDDTVKAPSQLIPFKVNIESTDQE